MARVLIAGCGYVGSALAARLAADGHDVWGMRRDPSRLPDGVRAIAADLSDPASLAGLPPTLDLVAYTGAADASTDDAYRAAYVDGPRNLLDALEGQGQRPRRVLFTSSTAVYGQDDGEWVDETSPTEPSAFTGTRMLEGERVFLDGPFPATVLRLGGIYGPGRTMLIDKVRRGEAECPSGPSWTNRIHRDDAAGALRHVMRLDSPDSLYLTVDREPSDLCDVYRWLARRLGAPEPAVRADAPVTRTRSRSNKRISSARLSASGYEFTYPSFREGYAEMIDAMAPGADPFAGQ